jgi:hypothetical protein
MASKIYLTDRGRAPTELELLTMPGRLAEVSAKIENRHKEAERADLNHVDASRIAMYDSLEVVFDFLQTSNVRSPPLHRLLERRAVHTSRAELVQRTDLPAGLRVPQPRGRVAGCGHDLAAGLRRAELASLEIAQRDGAAGYIDERRVTFGGMQKYRRRDTADTA